MYIINYVPGGKEPSIEKVKDESEEPKNWKKVTSVEDFKRLASSPYRLESRKGTDTKYEKEIEISHLEGRLESLSQELNYCKKDLKIKSPYLHDAILKKLKNINCDTKSLLSKDLPNVPQEYQERIIELNNNVQETIKDFAIKAEEYSNTKGINPEYSTIFKRIGKEAEFYLENLIPLEKIVTKAEKRNKRDIF